MLELVVFGFALQVSVLLAGLNLLAIQKDQITAESAARHSLRAYLLTNSDPAKTADEIVKASQSGSSLSVAMHCDSSCDQVGSLVSLQITLGKAKALATMVRQ